MPSDYRALLRGIIDGIVTGINSKLIKVHAPLIGVNMEHIVDRVTERNISDSALILSLHALRNHLCEFLYLTHLDERTRPFRIEVYSGGAILVLGSKDGVWRIATILSPDMRSGVMRESKSSFYASIFDSDADQGPYQL